MNSTFLCIFMLCILQAVSTDAHKDDVLKEYEPIFNKFNGIYGRVSSGAQNADYSFRTQRERKVTSLRSTKNSITQNAINEVNNEVDNIATKCWIGSNKENCLNNKDLDVANYTLKANSGFDTCINIYSNDTYTHQNKLQYIYSEVNRIYGIEKNIKEDCTKEITSDDSIRLCLFTNLYSNLLPQLNELENYKYNEDIQEGFNLAEKDADNCIRIVTEIIVRYYFELVVSDFKRCCNIYN